ATASGPESWRGHENRPRLGSQRLRDSTGRCADGERLDRLPEALQLEAGERFGLDDLLDLRQDPLADSDLARRRGVAEARGEIEDAADCAVVVATFEADPTDRRVADRHTEREVELV